MVFDCVVGIFLIHNNLRSLSCEGVDLWHLRIMIEVEILPGQRERRQGCLG